MRPVSEAINHHEKVLASIVREIHGHLLEWACWTRLSDDRLPGMGRQRILTELAICYVGFDVMIDTGPVYG